jgi:glycine cleavage system H protein
MDENVLCTMTQEYVLEKESNYEVGITDYEISNLGDIIFIELPDLNTKFSKGEVFATIESAMSAKELYMPISGIVVALNEEVAENPKLLNDENYENKWLIKIESDANQIEFADLLDYSDYLEEF